MSEQERQTDESRREEGGHTRTLVAEANHATAKSKSRRAEPGSGGGMTTGGRPKAERSYMGFLEIAGENAQRGAATGPAGGVGTQRDRQGQGAATWFPSARLHTYVRTRARAHVRTNCRERLFTVPRKQMCARARAHACVYEVAAALSREIRLRA